MTPKSESIFGKDHAQKSKCYSVLCASNTTRGAVVKPGAKPGFFATLAEKVRA
jgi:hypothetical protein